MFNARMKDFVIFLFLVVVLNTCAMRYGIHNYVQYTPINNTMYESRVENVLVYYEGLLPEEPFFQIGMIEAEGKEYASTNEILNYLKHDGRKQGADAIINVKKSHKTRRTGVLFEQLAENYEKEEYDSIVMQGIAIRFKDLESLPPEMKKQLFTTDESMTNYMIDERQQVKNEHVTDMVFTVLIWIGSAYALYLKLNCEEC